MSPYEYDYLLILLSRNYILKIHNTLNLSTMEDRIQQIQYFFKYYKISILKFQQVSYFRIRVTKVLKGDIHSPFSK